MSRTRLGHVSDTSRTCPGHFRPSQERLLRRPAPLGPRISAPLGSLFSAPLRLSAAPLLGLPLACVHPDRRRDERGGNGHRRAERHLGRCGEMRGDVGRGWERLTSSSSAAPPAATPQRPPRPARAEERAAPSPSPSRAGRGRPRRAGPERRNQGRRAVGVVTSFPHRLGAVDQQRRHQVHLPPLEVVRGRLEGERGEGGAAGDQRQQRASLEAARGGRFGGDVERHRRQQHRRALRQRPSVAAPRLDGDPRQRAVLVPRPRGRVAHLQRRISVGRDTPV